MEFYIRVDEASKTAAQIAQREATYEAVKILRAAGVRCEVREVFTGKSPKADAAAIILEMPR